MSVVLNFEDSLPLLRGGRTLTVNPAWFPHCHHLDTQRAKHTGPSPTSTPKLSRYDSEFEQNQKQRLMTSVWGLDQSDPILSKWTPRARGGLQGSWASGWHRLPHRLSLPACLGSSDSSVGVGIPARLLFTASEQTFLSPVL